jgi:HD-GYP domain-containing protein (c-di-GMP phosphodiesterase class II)
MTRRANKHSIFSQKLDRAVFVAYFLGAVVPLVALGAIFARPAIENAAAQGGYLSQAGALAQMGVLASAAALCLGSFFVLRRFAVQTLQRLRADQERLARLVDVSQSVSQAQHTGEVARSVAQAALVVCEGSAAYVFLASEKGMDLDLIDHAGREADKIYTMAQRAVDAMVRMALETRRPALVGSDGKSSAGLSAAAAVPLAIRSGQRGVLVAVHTERHGRFDTQHVGALTTLAGMAGVAVSNADLRDAQRNFFAHMTDLLVTALDAYLDYQVGHSRRVAEFANVMGRELRFDDERLQGLHFASLMHDVGMFRIHPDHWGIPAGYQKHPRHGARMLERIRLWEELAPFVAHHHEWWNGAGYPDGIEGEAIPLEARIIGTAEAFDSMISASYRPARSVEEALSEIESGAGTQFDPELAALFTRLVRAGAVRVKTD